MARYSVSDQAEDDLFDIWLYISVQGSRDTAQRMNSRFQEHFRLLAEQPLMGRSRSEWAPDLRSFPVGNYLVFYRPTDYGVEVVRVLHGSRDIEAMF